MQLWCRDVQMLKVVNYPSTKHAREPFSAKFGWLQKILIPLEECRNLSTTSIQKFYVFVF